MIQIWTALITILILKALKAIRLNIFVKIDLQKWLDKPFDEPPKEEPCTIHTGGYFLKKEKTK